MNQWLVIFSKRPQVAALLATHKALGYIEGGSITVAEWFIALAGLVCAARELCMGYLKQKRHLERQRSNV